MKEQSYYTEKYCSSLLKYVMLVAMTKIAHSPPPKHLDYKTALHEEHHLLEAVDVPIVTLSSTHRQGLADHFHESFSPDQEIVFSRAHYSMALAVLLTALKKNQTAWMIDPTNYVTREDWHSVLMTQAVGRLMARHKPLKKLKDLIDTQARQKLPISDPIKDPLLYLTKHVTNPIISMHYETGRILAAAGHQVIQVITDPHVRPQYLDLINESISNIRRHNITYCVFDDATKTDLLYKADEAGKSLFASQIIVTGPPVDPRIVACRSKKLNAQTLKRSSALRLAITTGGVGTNKAEIKTILDQLDQQHFDQRARLPLKLFLYASTHQDFRSLYQNFAARIGIKPGKLHDSDAKLRIGYAPDLVHANEILIDYVFPWADGFVTKPSGDMAYDAVASGSFCLFLEAWGEWEQNIQTRFLSLGLAHDMDVAHFLEELSKLSQPNWNSQTWYQSARQKIQKLPETYTHGAQNIIQTHERAKERAKSLLAQKIEGDSIPK